MTNDIKRSLLLSLISFSKSIKLSINENENYVATSQDKTFNLDNISDIEDAFRHIAKTELNQDISFNCDDDYFNCYLHLIDKNYDSLNSTDIIQNSTTYNSLFTNDKYINKSTILTLNVLNEKPQKISNIRKLLGI